MAALRRVRPLVVVTRAAEDARPMLSAIEALGAEALAMPCLQPSVLPRRLQHAALLRRLPAMQAIAFASRHGALGLRQWLTEAEQEQLASRPLYAVGPSTARAVEAAYGQPAKEASPSDAAHLLQLLLAELPPGQHEILLPAARQGRQILREGLAHAGHRPHFLPVYETLLPGEQPTKRTLWPRPPAFILFGSPSAVTGFLQQAVWPATARAISIGPATSQALAARNLAVYREAEPHTAGGLLSALAVSLSENH